MVHFAFFFFSWDLQHGKTAGHKTKALQTVFGNNEKWLHWTSAASTQRNQDLNPKEAHWVCEVLWKLNEIMEQNLKNISNILKNKKKKKQEMKPKFTTILTMDKKGRTIIIRRQQCLGLRSKPFSSFVVFSYSEWKSRLIYFLIFSRFSMHSWRVLLNGL